MATTTFTDYNTVIVSAWLNDVNAATYNAGVPVTATGVQGQIATLNTAVLPVPQLAGKNVIVNGDCSIAQLNGGALLTPLNATWPFDMFYVALAQPSKLQMQQVTNQLNSLGASFSFSTSVLASYVPGASEAFFNSFPIEGNNFARFQYGTANAKAGSLQFKVRASVGGTYSGCITNYARTRAYPFTYTVVANTDTLIQIPNIPGDSGGTWVGASNAGAAYILFDTGSGTGYKGTANSWQTCASNLFGVTGSVPLVSQVNGSSLTISEVQFELGAVCTQFEKKLFSQLIQEAQRYLRPIVNGGGGTIGQCISASQAVVMSYGTPMRAAPTLAAIAALGLSTAGGGSTTAPTISGIGMDAAGCVSMNFTGVSGLVSGNATYLNTGNAYLSAYI